MAGASVSGQRARSWTVERRAELLAGVPLFAQSSPATIRTLAALFRPRDVPRGGFVFHEGQPASTVNLAAEGRIKIVRKTDAGRQVILRLIFPGEVFGVSGGWGAAMYPASARTLDDAVVLQLPAREFTRLLATDASLALAVISNLGARLREAEARILDLETEGVEARLARALLRLASRTPQSAIQASITLTRQDLADLAGTTLSTTSRTLAAWHRQGIVAALRERVTILAPEALALIAARP